jgi:hypothetical protein
MTVVKEFVAAVAMTGKGMTGKKILIGQVYSNKIFYSILLFIYCEKPRGFTIFFCDETNRKKKLISETVHSR